MSPLIGITGAARQQTAHPLWTWGVPITWGKGDTSKLITSLTQRMKN